MPTRNRTIAELIELFTGPEVSVQSLQRAGLITPYEASVLRSSAPGYKAASRPAVGVVVREPEPVVPALPISVPEPVVPEAVVTDQVRRVKTPVELPEWVLDPDVEMEYKVSNTVQPVVNVDLVPIRTYEVTSGTAGDAWSAAYEFGVSSVRLDVYAATNPLDVALTDPLGAWMPAIHIPAGFWQTFEVRSGSARFMNHTPASNSVYQMIVWH